MTPRLVVSFKNDNIRSDIAALTGDPVINLTPGPCVVASPAKVAASPGFWGWIKSLYPTVRRAFQSLRTPRNTSSVQLIPGRVQSRINIANGRTRFTPLKKNGKPVPAGWRHIRSQHFNRDIAANRSIFIASEAEVKAILQQPHVVHSTVKNLGGGQYSRVVDTRYIIGKASLNQGGGPTSWVRIISDEAGNIITAYPVGAPK
jgi:hypothetical protein